MRHGHGLSRTRPPPCVIGHSASQAAPQAGLKGSKRWLPSAGFALLGALRPKEGWRQRRKGRPRKAEEPRWDPSAPVWSEEDLEDAIVTPGACHSHTLVYLHAFGRCGKEYVQPMVDQLSPGFSVPWLGGARCSGLRVVLPTAPKERQPWGPLETTWHEYERADSNRVGDPSSLEQTRQRLEKILREEVALLGGRSELVFLGGLSQGCTAALDIYLQLASKLRLGGFVGSVGFLPRDAMGFGNDERIEALLQDEVQRERPVWLQCAEDDQWVPWKELTEPSFADVMDRWPGLQLRTVRGRGHVIDQWELPQP